MLIPKRASAIDGIKCYKSLRKNICSIIMVSKRPKKAKLTERQFVLRLPEYQALFLTHLVELGAYKSLNDAIVKLLDAFIADLKRSAEAAKNE